MRKVLGWLVAQAYRFAGARRRAVARVKAKDLIVPVVIHSATAGEVRAILAWCRKKGVLDNLWLSFDDGWNELAETVAVLEEFGKPATVFVSPAETERGRSWTTDLPLEVRRRLYRLPAEERYGEIAGFTEIENDANLLFPSEIRRLARHPLIRLGNHTWSHLSCTHRPVAEVLAEVDRAQATLTEWGGTAPTDFAYPFGRGTPELDAEIRKRGMTPHYTRQGFVTRETLGEARNMVREGFTLAENLGRIFMAWPRVGETL